MTDSSLPPLVIYVENTLWEPGDDWQGAVQHLQKRFARLKPLDAKAVLSHESFAEQSAALYEWTATLDIDLERELARYFDEHLSMFVKPNTVITRRVRELATTNELHAVTSLPERAAESLLRHGGVWRSIGKLHSTYRTGESLYQLAGQLSGEIVAEIA